MGMFSASGLIPAMIATFTQVFVLLYSRAAGEATGRDWRPAGRQAMAVLVLLTVAGGLLAGPGGYALGAVIGMIVGMGKLAKQLGV